MRISATSNNHISVVMEKTAKRITKRKETQSCNVPTKRDSIFPANVYAKTLKNVIYLLLFILVCNLSWGLLSRIYAPNAGTILSSQSSREHIYNITCQTQTSGDPIFSSCSPRKCARIVVHDFLSPHQVSQLILLVKKVLRRGSSLGGVSIFDLHSGAISKGDKFINIYSIHATSPVFDLTDSSLVHGIIEEVHSRISVYFGIEFDNIFLTNPTFFSEITARPAYNLHDEYWHTHVDKETYGGFEYTSLIYLSDQETDFRGGSFFYENNGHEPGMKIQPRSGLLSIFTSGKENPHRVEKVIEGVRYALTIGFTCNPNNRIQLPTSL